ncbi:MAG: recombinase family protein [Pseudomonadota bacterium]|nr:recombinase family protein [Pseudomonadota bacterium]
MSRSFRCAIYTRKSTDEGLDQSFNSLDAQREACEAYIRSQAGEGWKVLAAKYDDGGYSGGNLDRPGMQQLLGDIEVGKVDVIVVYKVDRLTRSLMDFAKIVERLDTRGVSFVSVTQAFNTTTSMGRLTLNVLLSFAQFEREVTGERIRDKIAASKAKGMWMGGNLPLGYDLGDRELIVNPVEAEQVRHIFNRYAALGSGVKLAHELRRDGMLSKHWTSRSGRSRGRQPFSCGALYYLLQNRLYLGEIVHKGLRHAGSHEAIVGMELFDAVRDLLATRRRNRRAESTRAATCHLAGLVYDASGEPMGTSFSYGRGERLYRYYVSGSLDPNRSDQSRRPVRVSAGAVENMVQKSIARVLGRTVAWNEMGRLVERVQLNTEQAHIVLALAEFLEPLESAQAGAARLAKRVVPDSISAIDGRLRITVDWRPAARRQPSISRLSPDADGVGALLKDAHELLRRHSMSPMEPDVHSKSTAPTWQRQRRLMALGLLAPDLQRSMLEGRIRSLTGQLSFLAPLAWSDQRQIVAGRLS